MKGSLAAMLRALVLPFGATTGQRIVLDGVNGVINIYNTSGNVVAAIDANGMKVIGNDGTTVQMATGGAAQLWLRPPNTPGVPSWINGFVVALEDGTTEHRALTKMVAPSTPTGDRAELTLTAAGLTQNTTSARLYADTVVFTTLNGNGVMLLTGSSGRVSVHTGGVEETWHPLTYLNGWSNLGGGYVAGQYKKVASPPNSVMLTGVMNVGTKTSGAVIANLPAGYRPISKVRIPVSSNGTNSGGQSPAFDIQVNGDITVASGAGFPATATDCEVNAVFPLDAA